MQRTTPTTRPPDTVAPDNAPRYNGAPDTGFTLIEMLVVVSIISIVVALSFPMIGAMKRDNSASAGVNSISIAISAARRYATDPAFKFVSTDIDTRNTDPNEPGLYSGVAAIFTPAGEIRLTKNDESAQCNWAGIWYLERHGPNFLDLQNPGQPERELNGFKDIGIDYVLLGSDIGVAGIFRNNMVGANDPPLLLPPPFAIWFDQNGYMITTGQNLSLPGNPDNAYQYVYYDGDLNGYYDCNKGRWVPTYDPNEYDPNHPEFDEGNYVAGDGGKYKLGFDRLEAVIGVFVFSKEAFGAAVDDGTVEPWDVGASNATENQKRWDWMKANGQMVLFSKQTGMIMRNRDE